jgi:hypothetical protein
MFFFIKKNIDIHLKTLLETRLFMFFIFIYKLKIFHHFYIYCFCFKTLIVFLKKIIFNISTPK